MSRSRDPPEGASEHHNRQTPDKKEMDTLATESRILDALQVDNPARAQRLRTLIREVGGDSAAALARWTREDDGNKPALVRACRTAWRHGKEMG